MAERSYWVAILDPTKASFYGTSVAVEIWREAIFLASVGRGRNVGRRAAAFDFPTYRIAVIDLVAVHETGHQAG